MSARISALAASESSQKSHISFPRSRSISNKGSLSWDGSKPVRGLKWVKIFSEILELGATKPTKRVSVVFEASFSGGGSIFMFLEVFEHCKVGHREPLKRAGFTK